MNNFNKIEEISFNKRLKDLMNDKGKNNKPMSQIELKRLLDTMNNNVELVTSATISKWIRGKAGLRKNKDVILKYLAIIFDVDVDYLDCKQVEKKKENKIESLENTAKEKQEHELKVFYDYLNSIGFKVRVSDKIREEKTIINNTVYNGVKGSTYILYYKRKKKFISEEEFESFRKSIHSYTEFMFNKLKEL